MLEKKSDGAGTMKGIRLGDVAKRAGVSPATVTRVVRGNGYVSAQKRALVEAAMRELGYDAEQPRPQTCPTVLMLLSRGGLLFAKIAEAVACAVQAQGWRMVQYYTGGESPEEIREVIERMRGNDLKGVVFNCNGEALGLMEIRKYLTSLPVPLVMVERSPDIYGLNRVMMHSKESVFNAVRYLAHAGHRRIAFIGVGGEDLPEVERMRKAGFEEGAAAMGLGDAAVFWPISGYEAALGVRAMEALLARPERPTAVIAPDVVMAGVSNCLYARGLRVPEDVSLVGIDDTMAQFAVPPLTSVAFPVEEIAENTVRILVEAQQGGRLPQNVLLSTRLVERGSVAAPKDDDVTGGQA